MTQSRSLAPTLLFACLALAGCATANVDPKAAEFDDYYSEKDDPNAGAAGEGGETATPGRAVAKSVTGTKAAKIAKHIKPKLPPIKDVAAKKKKKRKKKKKQQGDDKPKNVTPPTIDGVVPTISSVGSRIEIVGEGLDVGNLRVEVGGKLAKINERSPDRTIVTLKAGGQVTVGNKPRKKKYKVTDKTELELEVLQPDEGFGKPRLDVDQGVVGNVYAINDTSIGELPRFDDLGDPIGTIALDNFSIPAYSFEQALSGRSEWFGIHFRGSLNILEDGVYNFCMLAGSGALLFLDGTDIIDNDGKHEPKEVCTEVEVGAGEYALDLLWYHGDESELALTLSWSKDGGPKEAIPTTALFPPDDEFGMVLK